MLFDSLVTLLIFLLAITIVSIMMATRTHGGLGGKNARSSRSEYELLEEGDVSIEEEMDMIDYAIIGIVAL